MTWCRVSATDAIRSPINDVIVTVGDRGRGLGVSESRQQDDQELLALLSSDIDITKPSMARAYDYLLGGKNNFEVDR